MVAPEPPRGQTLVPALQLQEPTSTHAHMLCATLRRPSCSARLGRGSFWKCWQTRTPYSEVKYLESLRKKGSSLLLFTANNPAKNKNFLTCRPQLSC